jgi:hypothetical protein
MTRDCFRAYLDALDRVAPDSGYRPVDEFFYQNQVEAARLAEELNRMLGLGPRARNRRFQPDLPLLGVGAWRGVVLLSANPGFRDPAVDVRNAREDEYRRRSIYECMRFTTDFFEVHPEVLGARLSFWSKPIGLLGRVGWRRARLAAGIDGDGNPRTTRERWLLAHKSRLFGGWELLPWHSESDGFRAGVLAHPRIRHLCEASFRAALRAKPEVLVVASAAGYELVRDILKTEEWREATILKVRKRRALSIPIARCVAGTTAVIAVRWQMFAKYSPLAPDDILKAASALGHPRP